MARRILQPIVGVERTHNGHVATYLEVLACGHTGQGRRDPRAVQQALAAGTRRACYRCNHPR